MTNKTPGLASTFPRRGSTLSIAHATSEPRMTNERPGLTSIKCMIEGATPTNEMTENGRQGSRNDERGEKKKEMIQAISSVLQLRRGSDPPMTNKTPGLASTFPRRGSTLSIAHAT
eukprot:CAMPEP_0172301172 /NCGR_PEP_ID=MMETSP1058-20130122/3118_1 /TAXON_ID=83371 /ORGANISM="Detonula confervacea, Strain CCMP 353" /LENGTH=115 /DNA_ID=CAMNT_0013011197 /DNA_START=15 /DNA_END=359 /DNA_ORIENTATION=+